MGALLVALKAWVRVSPWRFAPSGQTRDEIGVVLAGQRWGCRKPPQGRLQAPCCDSAVRGQKNCKNPNDRSNSHRNVLRGRSHQSRSLRSPLVE